MGEPVPKGRALRLEREKSQRLLDTNAKLIEDVARSRRIGQIAMRDAITNYDRCTGVCLAAESVEYLLQVGHREEAALILRAIRGVHLAHLRGGKMQDGQILSDPDGRKADASSDAGGSK